MTEVETIVRQLEKFRPLIGDGRADHGLNLARKAEEGLASRVVWNVNSTAVGGGVAEMLRGLLGYVRGAGIDCRWATIDAGDEFFHVTKRLHHALHGSLGDGSPLDDKARRVFEETGHRNAKKLLGLVKPFDVVLLHDPQTAGMAPLLIDADITVIWRCHIGHDEKGAEVRAGWEFLRPYLRDVPALVFSREGYIPAYVDKSRCHVITPSIDAFSPKNQEMDDATIRSMLAHVGLVDGPEGEGERTFTRDDGSVGHVEHGVDVMRSGRAPLWETPLIVQVSRWDPLKDMTGVLHGFHRLVVKYPDTKAALVLAGPDVHAIADDPEGAQVFNEVLEAWRALPDEVRERVHLANLPMHDVDENGAIVNALQRHAAVVVQKSLHEGFGLTVTEAMWKARPVVASAVGGIRDQIEDGDSGLLLDDPTDLDAFVEALRRVLTDRALARRLGEQARERVREHFLGFQHLIKYAELIAKLDQERAASGGAKRKAAAR